jgi:TetR/AcrR family transcriptional regulator
MEKFLNLSEEKQNKIIDAALKSFGSNGYRKTSVSDIAKAAEISKSMVFHYFGTKKDLYLYLIKMCGDIVMTEINNAFDNTITDFFERIKHSSELKVAIIKRYTNIPAFLTSVYFENEPEVKADIESILTLGEDFRNKIALDGMDTTKFKEGIDPKLVLKILVWMAEGYSRHLSLTELDFDVLLQEFYECMDLLKRNFYKEEYL